MCLAEGGLREGCEAVRDETGFLRLPTSLDLGSLSRNTTEKESFVFIICVTTVARCYYFVVQDAGN